MSRDRNSILQILILSVLIEEDALKSASEILEILEDGMLLRTNWTPHRGSIYPAIKQLVSKGYLKKSEKYTRPMKFKPSQAGLKRLPSMIEDLLTNIANFFEFIDLIQENIGYQNRELRHFLLRELTTLLEINTTRFKEAIKEDPTEWKEIHVR
ncbi:MAG: PadR family transcriptional regulator [Candidatus Heimdallarchaeota archaeon]|nr:MAG: PadR family transcriptional regulator [Candidatus Heimdallarchaeota archaeon]